MHAHEMFAQLHTQNYERRIQFAMLTNADMNFRTNERDW